MHLGDAEFLRDLGLGEVAEEAQQHDGSFALGQLGEQRAQGFVVLDVGERGVVVAESVDERKVLGAVAGGGVDRDGLVSVAGDEPLRDLLGGEIEFGGEFADGGSAPVAATIRRRSGSAADATPSSGAARAPTIQCRESVGAPHP